VNGAYARLAHDVLESSPGAEVYFNAPEHRASAGAVYTAGQWSGSATLRWQSDFDWASGVFAGAVPSFAVVDLDVRYDVSPHWRVGATIANTLNKRHYEAFGADLLRRIALLHLTWTR
jgi:outer membrane receptor protein involved in Fe transport